MQKRIYRHLRFISEFCKMMIPNLKIDIKTAMKITSRVKVDSVVWSCVRFTDKIEWIREDSILNSNPENKEKYQKLTQPDVFDPSEKENFEKVKKEMNKQVEETIKQYESRIQKNPISMGNQ